LIQAERSFGRPGPVLGRYEPIETLGRGATSIVYRAHDRASGAEVALKVVPVELGLHERVEREVRAAALLSHRALVPILDWGEDDEHLYIVSELVEGTPMDRLYRDGRLAGHEEFVLHAAADVLEALEHAHRRGVIHRDVKPANIILGEDGHARLTDLGVARVVGDSSLTMTGGVVGTVAYMAPEQAVGKTATGASDVYATALLVYEGLVGRNPILGGGPADVARRAAAGDVPPLAKERPDLPQRLTDAINLALAKDPAARPTPGVLAAVVRKAAEDWADGRRPRRRGVRALPALANAAGGALLVGLAVHRIAHPSALVLAAGALVGAAAFARAPRAATIACAMAGLVILAGDSTGAALVVGAIGLALLVAAPRNMRRTFPLPLAAPLLFGLGLGPLFAVAVACLAGARARLWTLIAGSVCVVSWQVFDGSSTLFLASADVGAAGGALDGVRDPTTVGRRLVAPFRENPEALVGAFVFVLFALAFPFVRRIRAGGGRDAAVVVWVLALSASAIAVGGAGPVAIEVLLPSCIILAAWAAHPWRRLFKRAESPSPAIHASEPVT
jgi:eukaryotic-like serine/threonine-protein kinase